MINIYKVLDKNKYKIIQTESGFKVHYVKNNMLNQEIYLRIEKKLNKNILYSVSRDIHKEIGEFNDETIAMSVIIVLCYKYFESVPDDIVIKKIIREAADKNDMKIIDEIFRTQCQQCYYEIFNLKEGAMCIIKNDNLFNVCYYSKSCKLDVLTNVEFKRAIVVLFNYVKKLKIYDELYENLRFSYKFNDVYYYKLIKYYLL